MKARVLSGVQPSGQLHIGNYLGALKNWAEIQNRYESIFCIVDLHAVTVYQDPQELLGKIRETAALFIAAGIDPEESSIVVQSSIPGHSELAWLLTCVTPLGWLQRMTQFKAKAEKQETVGSGMLQYPVLMAADILLYQASVVPVGDDQAQHLELTETSRNASTLSMGKHSCMPATHLPSSWRAHHGAGRSHPEDEQVRARRGPRHRRYWTSPKRFRKRSRAPPPIRARGG